MQVTTEINKDKWNEVKKSIPRDHLDLGPYFANQALNQPRHLLFTLARYKFAAKLLPQNRNIDVLELGCNEGLGTMMLAERGHRVTAVDLDQDAIAHAQKTLAKPNVKFIQSDFLGKSFGKHDAAVSLDVIEHIPKEYEESYMKTIVSNLGPAGFCIVGTPNDTASPYASPASQIGHVNMFTGERLNELVSKHFNNVFIFGMNDEVMHTGFYPMCHYLFALGCGKKE
jgi:2-polyprenyl-3-methyl-5-hydroxy-6-metoxy-1,4-benzoquinol methylase